MAIITYPLGGITYDSDDAQTYFCTRTSGVYSDDDCFDISISDALTVTISPGLAWIKNADYAGKSVCVTESVDLEISPGGTLPRTDRVVLRFSKSANASELAILEGTESSTYPAPDLTQEETTYELGLYTIYVKADATSISTSNITDTRLDEDVCGVMSDGVTSIPTATLQAQTEAILSELADDVSETATELSDAISEIKSSYESQLESIIEEYQTKIDSATGSIALVYDADDESVMVDLE